jgi:branched-chain amino acid transport system substrate-binding protein
MRFGRTLGAAIVVCSLGAGLAIAACKDSSPSPPPAVNQAVTDTITIGASLSLTGSLNYLGAPEELGARAAVAQVNALGGVLGKSLNIVVIDDTTDPATSNNAFKKLVDDNKAFATIGPTGSPAAVVAGPTMFAAQIIQISPSASTPVMTDAQPAHDRFFFRTAASHALQAKALARWMTKGAAGVAPCRKPAVIYQDDAFGAPIAAGFAASIATQTVDGGSASVSASIKVPSTAKNSYTDEVQQVMTSGADCQLLALFQPLGKQYVIDWVKATSGNPAYATTKFLTLGCNALQADSFLSSTRANPADPKSPTAAEGMYVLNFDQNPATPEYGDFRNIYTAAYPFANGETDVSPYAANAYDAVILAALAIEQAGGVTDKIKLRDALFAVSKGGTSYGPGQVGEALADIRAGKDIDYKGASGDVDFDDFGDVLQDFVVYSITTGAFQLVERIKSSTL